MGKLSFIVGAGVGYVLGARAGRERYEAIKRGSNKLWQSPTVKKGVHKVEGKVSDVARERGSVVTDKVASAVKAKLGENQTPPPTPPQPR
ncbi:hypothetical protein [Georgenia deserti]|uniref:YtxH domain-containing protein n=1 Tax=Georgenia deserti TaxID=2093781 RepID=A0ABW4L3M8_9MICO